MNHLDPKLPARAAGPANGQDGAGRIAVVIGSTRPGRICADIAAWSWLPPGSPAR
jgi:hypothetical protein